MISRPSGESIVIAETSPSELTDALRSQNASLNLAAMTFLESNPRALMTSCRVIESLSKLQDLPSCLNCNNGVYPSLSYECGILRERISPVRGKYKFFTASKGHHALTNIVSESRGLFLSQHFHQIFLRTLLQTALSVRDHQS